jgi:AbrB family looped-hinge helix DNA binding protein
MDLQRTKYYLYDKSYSTVQGGYFIMFKDMKFWGSATVGAKGQIVIPSEARTELDIKEGDKVIVVSAGKKPGLLVIKADSLEKMIKNMHDHLGEVLEHTKNMGKE